MNPPDDPQLNAASLRRLAEAELAARPADEVRTRPAADLLHELQVHQIELEMQNETLRQAQSALEASRDRYVDLYEFAPVGYLSLDATGMIARLNLTAVTLLGVEPKDVLHRPFTLLVTPEDQPRWMTLFTSVRAQGGQGRIELTMQRRDGTVFPAQLDCTTQKVMRSGIPGDGAGETALRIAVTDITERKAAEAALQASEMKYRLLAENAADCIFWLDSDGRYRYLSPACTNLTGYAPEDFLTDPGLMLRLIHPDDRARYQFHIVQGVEDACEMDLRIVRRDGELRWISHHCRPLCDDDGRDLGRRGSNHDITERKRAEARLAEQLDELRRWHQVTLGREGRIRSVKKEVNDLLAEQGQPPRYPSALDEGPAT